VKIITACCLALLLTACHVDPQEPGATVDQAVRYETECVGADCDDVEGSATFCGGDLVCHRPTQGYRLPTVMPNGQRSCPPGFALTLVGAPNQRNHGACDVARAFAWPQPCEVGCQGDVRLPVTPAVANGCCTFDFTRDCDPAPMCSADEDEAR
jgi:hypothetical protein